MVASIVAVTALLFAVFVILYIITLPYIDEWARERHQTERKQLERDEALVKEAVREVEERNRAAHRRHKK